MFPKVFQNWFSFLSIAIKIDMMKHEKSNRWFSWKFMRIKMALFYIPFIYELLRTFARKTGLWKCLLSHFGVLVLNHSSNNTVFCLQGFVSLKKVEDCLYIIYWLLLLFCIDKVQVSNKSNNNNLFLYPQSSTYFFNLKWVCYVCSK